MKHPRLITLVLLLTTVIGCAKKTNETSAPPPENSVGSLRTYMAPLQEANMPVKMVTYSEVCKRQFEDYVRAYAGLQIANTRLSELIDKAIETEIPVAGKTLKFAEGRVDFYEGKFNTQSVIWNQSGCSRLME